MFFRLGYILILLFLFLINVCVNGEVCYRLMIGGLTDCDEYDNQYLLTEQVVQVVREDEETGEKYVVIGGYITLKIQLEEGIAISVEVVKESENGKEIVFSLNNDWCSTLKDEKAPHRMFMEQLNVNGCPVDEGIYSFKENGTVSIDLSVFKDKLTHEFVGDYLVIVMFAKGPTEIVSCHVLAVTIQEYEEENTCP